MKGDFSRFTFDPLKNYITVLKQQGRVELDSDWNEQAELFAENLRQLAADLLGPLAIPLTPDNNGYANSNALAIGGFSRGTGGVLDFTIGKGSIYIGGYYYRLPKDITYRTQADYPEPEMPDGKGDYLVYLEAWRKSVSYIDDESIREPALGGPDTCMRTRLLGQVRLLVADDISSPEEACRYLTEASPPSNITLTLHIDQSAHQLPLNFGEVDLGGGLIPGNLHYRLEIHRGMEIDGNAIEGIKWSDENGSVLARALKSIDSRTILAEEPELVTGESFKPGDWVEVSNIVTELHRHGGQMAQIERLDSTSGGLLVTLDSDIHPLLTRRKNGNSTLEAGLLPRLQRWSGYITPLTLKNNYNLGRGVKVTFGSSERRFHFEPGDYWTYAIRDREYNRRHVPVKALPSGIKKYRYPLAIIKRGPKSEKIIDCRRFFKPLATPGTD